MNWPFVTRARFADREREILELRRELREMKDNHERVLDEINFRSTGFHLYPRFAHQQEMPLQVGQPEVKAEERTGIAGAIDKVGTRPSAVRQYLEATQAIQMDKARQEELERMPEKEVLAQLNRALELGSNKAKQAQA